MHGMDSLANLNNKPFQKCVTFGMSVFWIKSICKRFILDQGEETIEGFERCLYGHQIFMDHDVGMVSLFKHICANIWSGHHCMKMELELSLP